MLRSPFSISRTRTVPVFHPSENLNQAAAVTAGCPVLKILASATDIEAFIV